MGEINKRLDFLIRNENLVNREVADVLDVTETTIRYFRKGGKIKKLYIEKIANYYGYNINWLLKGEGEMKISKSSETVLSKSKLREKFGAFDDKDFVTELVYRKESLQSNDVYRLFIEKEALLRVVKVMYAMPEKLKKTHEYKEIMLYLTDKI